MEKKNAKELYKQFKSRLEITRKQLRLTEMDIVKRDNTNATINTFFGKRTMKLSTMIRYFKAMGYDINGLFNPKTKE